MLSTLPSNTVQVRKAIGNVGSGKESAGVWVRWGEDRRVLTQSLESSL